MRTTVTLADDVAAALERLRREQHLGTSEAVNELIRRGLATTAPRADAFVQETFDLRLAVDVTNVAEALEQLDGAAAR